MPIPGVEHSSMVDGSPAGSPAHDEFMASMFDGESDAEISPVTSPDEKTEDQPEDEEIEQEADKAKEKEEAETEEEEELDPLVKAELDKLKKLTAELEERIKGQDKYFTEQSEKLKKLREEAGVEDINKADKAARKDMKALGFNADGEYIARDYTRKHGERSAVLSDEILDHIADKGYIPKQLLPTVKGMRPILNALLNDIREELLTTVRSEVDGIHKEYKPIKEERATEKLQGQRVQLWSAYIGNFREKYKPTPEQEDVLREEIPRLWEMVDNSEPVEVEKALRRIIHDPEVLKKSAAKPKKAKPREEPAKVTQKAEPGKVDTSKHESILSSMYD